MRLLRYSSVMAIPKKHKEELLELFSSINTHEEAEALLEDLLTPQEMASLAERWQLVKELAAGTPQRDIAKKLKLSISKITRGSRVLQYGTGGLPYFIEKLKDRL